MCEHCGCRGVEPIAQLMDEHLELLDLGGEARRALALGDRQAVLSALGRLGTLLDAHVRREERGLFAALKEQGDYADAVTDLEAEHAGFDTELALVDVDAPDLGARLERLLAELTEHIDKENLGVFPVAVVTLGAMGWETVGRAHQPEAAG